MRKIILFLFYFFIFSPCRIYSQTKNFNLDIFKDFSPETSLEEIKKKGFRYEVASEKLEMQILKIYLPSPQQNIRLLVQFSKGKVTDFMANFPSFYLHDVFHQALINRFGKQNEYIRREENALYLWKDEKNLITRIYNATCTITCFPIFYSEIKNEFRSESLYEKFKTSFVSSSTKSDFVAPAPAISSASLTLASPPPTSTPKIEKGESNDTENSSTGK